MPAKEITAVTLLEELVGLEQQSWTLQNTQYENGLAILQQLKQLVASSEACQALLAQIYAALNVPDVASFNVSVATPTKQLVGENEMPNPVHSFKATVSQSMLDDQKALMTAQPLDSAGNPTSIPSGAAVPVWSVAPGTALKVAVPSTDPTALTCEATGVKTVAGTETVTISFTNADNSVATGEVVFTMTIDPAELDVTSFGITVSAPVSQ